MWSIDHPFALWALTLALAPLLWHGQRTLPHGWLPAVPPDPASRVLALALRLTGALTVVAAVLALSGLHRQGSAVEHVGTGAHIVITIDRSASMSDGFAGRDAKQGDEPKGQAAARLLEDFVRERPRDLFGMVAFSTAPVHGLSLTADQDAVRAAVRASAAPGVGLTNIAAGLTMALEQFRDKPVTGSRVVLLVSDGAARIDARAQNQIRRLFAENRSALYWIFLRSAGGRGPSDPPDPEKGFDPAPEYFLNEYFLDLGVPYRLYEADTPDALQRAIADVSRLQNLPLRYLETPPREDLGGICLAIALAGSLVLLLARSLEVSAWSR
jgi:mxaC protein